MSTLPHLSYTVNGTVHPSDALTLGLGAVSLVTEVESGQLFTRTKWKGEITFVGPDFARFYALSNVTCCQRIDVTLTPTGTGCTVLNSAPWLGYFVVSDLSFDTDSGKAVLSTPPRPNDGYQTLMERWELPYNWLTTGQIVPIYSANRSIKYHRARLFTTVLAGMIGLTLANTPAAGLTPTAGTHVISQLLEEAVNPVHRLANELKGMRVIQASDVVRPGSSALIPPTSGFATKAEVSLKELLDDCQSLFRLFIFIDPVTGKLRLEHESFFPALSYNPPTVGYRLPADNPAWTGKKSVKTDKTGLYGLYTLSIGPNAIMAPGDDATGSASGLAIDPTAKADPTTYVAPTIPLDFNQASIDFVDPCVTRLKGETPISQILSVSRLATHIDASRFGKDKVSLPDWLFLVLAVPAPITALFDKTEQVPMGTMQTFGLPAENADLSAATLLLNYHRHNKPFASGVLFRDAGYLPDGKYMSMLSVAPLRQLGAVTIPYCCTNEPVSITTHIETWLGPDGQLARGEFKVAAQQLTLEIVHPSACQVPIPNNPFDPGQPQDPQCPLRGTYIRSEAQYDYAAGSVPGAAPIGVLYTFYFADGQCGEFFTTSYLNTRDYNG